MLPSIDKGLKLYILESFEINKLKLWGLLLNDQFNNNHIGLFISE